MNTAFKIDSSKITKLLHEKKILIPIYQRNYSWKEEHINALLDDLEARAKDGSEHFFGVIAISTITHSENGKNINISKIIDGQQRLTTSLILLMYLARNVKKIDLEDYEMIKKNKVDFKYELNSDLEENMNNYIRENFLLLKGTFKKNYETINKRFSKLDYGYLQELYNTFKNKFIVAILDYKIDKNEEMLVFENLNSKGAPLKSFDLIRNHIISLTNDNPKNNLKKFNIKLWNLTQASFKNIGNENKREEHIERFIEFYLIFKNNAALQKFVNYSTYKNFKKKYSEKMDNQNYDSLLDELRKFAILYFSVISKKNIGSNIWLITLAQKDNHIPFVFLLFSKFGEFDKNKEEWVINNKIDQYLKYSTIHLLKIMAVQGTGQSFTPMWVNIMKLVTNQVSALQLKMMLKEGKILATQETPSNKEFETALLMAPKQNWIPVVLINILEYIANKRNSANEKIDYNLKSIEHILPQKANIYDWPFIENNKEEYKQKVNLIGNLVNFNKNANSRLGNKAFTKKLEIYKESHSPLITGSNLEIEPLAKHKSFSFKIIEKRTKALIKDLIKEFE